MYRIIKAEFDFHLILKVLISLILFIFALLLIILIIFQIIFYNSLFLHHFSFSIHTYILRSRLLLIFSFLLILKILQLSSLFLINLFQPHNTNHKIMLFFFSIRQFLQSNFKLYHLFHFIIFSDTLFISLKFGNS